MAVAPGSRIGPYEVTSPLGAGGMGVVFRARDTKLHRDVALKLLPDHFANDGDRLSRFQREAQLLASLNHPNIAQIYGLEEANGAGCIVMELVEGETLAQRVKRGPLALDETLAIGRQVVDALEAAHERGIIHRDLKPANIKLTPDGKVKVLDFGLAKALGAKDTEGDFSNSPTRVSGSIAGVVLGTAAYMSPEQARGKQVDARTDVWAFGCTLFEMVTGRQAFGGETSTDIIAKIVAGQPSWDLVPQDTPPAIRMLLTTTLNKDPKQRLQHIGDVRPFLDPAFIGTVSSISAVRPLQRPRWRRRLLAASAVVAFGALLVPTFLYFRAAPVAKSEIRFEMAAPGLLNGLGNLSISPDGQRIAYIAVDEGRRMVRVRPIEAVTAQPLAGTENAAALFWSPDSRYLGFIADGNLKKIDIAGGPAQVLCYAGMGNSPGSWSREGVILFQMQAAPPVIARVSAQGGEAAAVTTIDPSRNEIGHGAPYFLPDGKHFLYHAFTGLGEIVLQLGSLDSKSVSTLMVLGNLSGGGGTPATYSPTGHLLFVRNGTLIAQSFDAKRLALSGEAIPLMEQVNAYAVSNNEVLIYRRAAGQPGQGSVQLVWFDRNGKPAGQVGGPGNYSGDVRLSPDGRRAAVDLVTGTNRDVWVIDLARGVPSRLTFEGANWSPIFAPDGSRVVFSRAPGLAGLSNRLYQKSSSGVGSDELLFEGEQAGEAIFPEAWSPDGRHVVFARVKFPSNVPAELWVLPLPGDRKAFRFLPTRFRHATSAFSPDSRWLAFTTNESGTYQIVIQPFPDPSTGKWQITGNGGTEPRWRADGRELYYLALDGKIMAVPIKADKTLEVGQPVPLFQTTLNTPVNPGLKRYDVTADGQRFLVLSPVAVTPGQTNSNPITAVVNWTGALDK
jgi:Tol biopolymer transport system component/tRNA A-37 threonylcarbamoyl transferase component Bud32